jgi:hypothetical protein
MGAVRDACPERGEPETKSILLARRPSVKGVSRRCQRGEAPERTGGYLIVVMKGMNHPLYLEQQERFQRNNFFIQMNSLSVT